MGPLPNPKHECFARLVVLGTPLASAYVQAGFEPGSDRNARAAGSRLAAQANIAARVEELRAERDAELFETLGVDRDLVVREYLRIVLAKPSDLVETEQVCCRHCHGREHLFQWRTEREFRTAHKDWTARAERAAKRRRRPEGDEPSAEGGYGFSTKRPPHPDCPACDGRGTTLLTVKASGDHPLLIGLRQTRDGVEVKLHDRMAALEALAKITGAFEADNVQRGSGDALKEALLARMRQANSLPVFNAGQVPPQAREH